MQKSQAREQYLTMEEVERKAAAGIDIRRLVESEEIAYLTTFLASPKASAITGEAIAAGGGVGSAVYQ